MKKRVLTLFTAAAISLFALSSTAFAGTVITDRNIREGLEFCREYPVGLTLNGEKITFSEKDVPPVIITPDGNTAGRTLIPVRSLFEKMGAKITWNEVSQTVDISYNGCSIRLVIGSSSAYINGVPAELDVPALIIDHDGDYYGSTMIPVRFVSESLKLKVTWDDLYRIVGVTTAKDDPDRGEGHRDPSGGGGHTEKDKIYIEGALFPEYDMSSLPQLTENAKSRLVVLDIGHGGHDTGAIGHRGRPDQLDEKDVNLKAGLAFRELAEKTGMNLYMTRDTDVYVPLRSRAEQANERNADIFISFHNNSFETGAAKGTTICYYSKTDSEGNDEMSRYGIDSRIIAKSLQKELVAAFGTSDRGISRRPELAVLNKTKMPAVIVEGAFLSNEEDFSLMKTDEFTKRYSFACAKALIEVMNEAYPDQI